MVHMVIPTDLPADALFLAAVTVVGYLIRFVFKPSKTEAMIIARVLVGFVLIVLKMVSKWNKEHRESVDKLVSDATLLKNKLNKRKIVIG